MSLVKGFVFELGQAIESHDGTDDHVADLELLADSSRGPGREYELRPYFLNDLLPDILIRQLGSILRHVRIRLEYHDRRLSDRGLPVSTQPLCHQCRAAAAHFARQSGEIMRVRPIVIAGILAWREHPTQRMPLI